MTTRHRWCLRAHVGAAVLLLGLGVPLGAQAPGTQPPVPGRALPPPAPVEGRWTMTLTLPVGTATPSVTFETEGDELSGIYAGRYGTFPLSGQVVGRVVTFTFQMGSDEQPVTVCFTGEWSEPDGTLVGTATLGALGTGRWTATRVPIEPSNAE